MMDDTAVRKTEAQLTLWAEEIKEREARLLIPGREARFAAVLHVDELRVMLATARARFEALQADPTGKRDLLKSEFDHAWKELAAAIDRRMPRP
jgi:hypothetical protein